MSWRYLSRISMSMGGVAILVGLVVHGMYRDSRVPDDRKSMILGTEIAVVGLLVLLGGAGLTQLSDRERTGDP